MDSDKRLTQIVARGPNVRPIQAGFIGKKSKTKIEHWQGVIKKKLCNDSTRKNQLAFDRQRPSSAARFYALRTLQIEEGLCKNACVVENEEAPFFFTDTIRVGDLRSFLEVREELLHRWKDRNLFEDSLATNVYFTDKDEQHKMKLRNCLVQVKLFATNLYRIAKPTFRNGRWIVIHADYLTVRPFSDCYITMVCPPGIQVEQVVYGEKESEPANIVAAISFEVGHDERAREHNRSKVDKFFQQTKCCFVDTIANTQLDEDSDVDNPRGESFTPKNTYPRDKTSRVEQQQMTIPLPAEKTTQDGKQSAHESVYQSDAVNQFPITSHQPNGITDVGGIFSDGKDKVTETRDEVGDVCVSTVSALKSSPVLDKEQTVQNCQQNQTNVDQNSNKADEASRITGVYSLPKKKQR